MSASELLHELSEEAELLAYLYRLTGSSPFARWRFSRRVSMIVTKTEQHTHKVGLSTRNFSLHGF